jgi:hypothetical protein
MALIDKILLKITVIAVEEDNSIGFREVFPELAFVDAFDLGKAFTDFSVRRFWVWLGRRKIVIDLIEIFPKALGEI